VALLFVLLHHRSSGDLGRSISVATRFLCRLFDVFVLLLFLAAYALEMLSSWHPPASFLVQAGMAACTSRIAQER
jgi:hypothetical protein